MFGWLLGRPPSQQKPEPSQAAIEERIEILERKLKRHQDEVDAAVDLVKEQAQTTRALNGRMTRMLETREKAAQVAPESTIVTPEGVQDPRQLPIPLEVQAARLRASRSREAIAAGGNH